MKPYAVNNLSLIERDYPIEPDNLRNDFQRDRDRIVHSKAFRRLEYKTQVFVNHLGDNYRTRLTHSIEVSQISRTVARALGLNEDLSEAIALAHDIGHPPFGHAGERALHRLMSKHGGFDHNFQSIRVLTLLENKYPNHSGLNLTQATILGLQKHTRLPNGMSHSLESLIVDVCDEIAYNNHDLDDGIETGLISLHQLCDQVEIWFDQYQLVESTYPQISEEKKIRYTIRNLINFMVKELVDETFSRINYFKIKDLNDVLQFKSHYSNQKLVYFKPKVAKMITELKRFLLRNLYRCPEVNKMNNQATETISKLFEFLIEKPSYLPEQFKHRVERDGIYRVIADFIAGMTDRYALTWYKKIISN